MLPSGQNWVETTQALRSVEQNSRRSAIIEDGGIGQQLARPTVWKRALVFNT